MEEHGHCETDEKHQICLAAFVFALGIFLPLLKEVKIALFLLAYLLAGRNVLFTSGTYSAQTSAANAFAWVNV